MKKVVILRGLPGSGKSFLVKEKYPEAKVVSADFFFERKEGGYQANFKPYLLPQAHAACFQEFMASCFAGLPLIVVDNTNVERFEYMNYLHLAIHEGYKVEIETLECGTPEQGRFFHARNTHGVPPGPFGRRWKKWAEVQNIPAGEFCEKCGCILLPGEGYVGGQERLCDYCSLEDVLSDSLSVARK